MTPLLPGIVTIDSSVTSCSGEIWRGTLRACYAFPSHIRISCLLFHKSRSAAMHIPLTTQSCRQTRAQAGSHIEGSVAGKTLKHSQCRSDSGGYVIQDGIVLLLQVRCNGNLHKHRLIVHLRMQSNDVCSRSATVQGQCFAYQGRCCVAHD